MNVISVFHVISTLYMVTTIHHKDDFLVKVIKVFYSVNLFTNRTKAAINSETIWKMKEDSRVKWSSKMKEDSRVKWSFFQRSYTMFWKFCSKSLCIKSYIHHWRSACNFRDANSGFMFEIWLFELELFQAGLIIW